jgi:Meiotically up-regulated gene 113
MRVDPTDKKFLHLKVGRATNLNRRMDQWGKQCGSKEQILRGFWPGGMDKDGVPMKGLVQAGPKGPWCHRLERLVHIELADLVTSTPYLEDGYPNTVANKEVKNGGKRDAVKCVDCRCSLGVLRNVADLCRFFFEATLSIKKFFRLSESRKVDIRVSSGRTL